MVVDFVLLVNKQGQTRLSQYRRFVKVKERVVLEGEIVRRCLSRREEDCSFFEYLSYKIVYKRYASLFFIVATSKQENELAIYELIHLLVETFNSYFENVCELDIMFNLEKAHFIVEEVLLDGCIIETNQKKILEPVLLLDKNS